MKRSNHFPWLFLVAALLTAGCESDKDKDQSARDKDLERIAKQERKRAREHDADPVIATDRDRLDDRTTDRRGMKEIPADAQAVSTGEGKRLEYEPTHDGVIYVYDADADQVVFVARIRDRERFRLDPDGGRALINSRTVLRSDLNPRHRYRLYFDRSN